MLKLLTFISIVLFLVSCEEQPLFDQNYSFDTRTWNQEEEANFSFEVNDLEQEYNLILTLRTTTDYAYNNLWIYLESTAPDSSTAKEALPISITNADGSWIGEKSGTIVDSKLIFKSRKFPLKGKYSFRLTQAVNQEEIGEILDIGLRVEKKI